MTQPTPVLGIVRQLPRGTHKSNRFQTDEADGVAVGPGAAKLHRCHLSSGTRHILDGHMDFVRQIFFQEGRQHARLKIEATAGFKRDDDGDVSGREGSEVFLLRTGTQQEKENYLQRCLRRRKIVRLKRRSMTAGDVAIAGLSAVTDRRYSTKAHPQRRS